MENNSNTSEIVSSIIIASMIIAGCLVYNQHQKIEFEKYKIKQVQQAKQEEELRKEDTVNTNKEMRDDCLADADISYHYNWTSACKKYGVSDKSKDCFLPSYLADDINQYYKDYKDECFKKYPVK